MSVAERVILIDVQEAMYGALVPCTEFAASRMSVEYDVYKLRVEHGFKDASPNEALYLKILGDELVAYNPATAAAKKMTTKDGKKAKQTTDDT